jgi:uncharacterized protein YodC (DUF2158 family)
MQMEKDWKVGDVVRPKAGGPDMCIAGFETDAASGERKKSAVCEWFVGKQSHTGSYQVEMLEFVREIDDVSFSSNYPEQERRKVGVDVVRIKAWAQRNGKNSSPAPKPR